MFQSSRDDELQKSNRITPTSGLPLTRSSHSRSSSSANEKRIRRRINWYNNKDCAIFNSYINCKLSGVSLQANSAFRCVVECRLGRQHFPAFLIVSISCLCMCILCMCMCIVSLCVCLCVCIVYCVCVCVLCVYVCVYV